MKEQDNTCFGADLSKCDIGTLSEHMHMYLPVHVEK